MVMTEKEHIVIHYAVLLPIVKKVLALDTQALKSSDVRLQEPYERLFQQAFDALQHDLHQLRLYMKKRIYRSFLKKMTVFSRITSTILTAARAGPPI